MSSGSTRVPWFTSRKGGSPADEDARRGITEKEYLTVVFCKTASLIAAAAETGAVLAGADPATRKAMFGFGKSVGIAFQLVDDILDFTGRRSRSEAPSAGSAGGEGDASAPARAARGKGPGPGSGRGAPSRSRSPGRRRRLSRRPGRPPRRDRVRRLRAKEYVRRGKRHLAGLPDSPARSALIALSDYVTSRTS